MYVNFIIFSFFVLSYMGLEHHTIFPYDYA